MEDLNKCDWALLRNLEDAGCDREMIERYIELSGREDSDKQLHLLVKHRRALLDEIHEGQKKLDCLDHLIYSLKTEKPGGEK